MRTNEGFTLLELTMAIVIFLLMSAIVLPNVISSRESTNFQTCVRNRQTIERAEKEYVLDHDVPSAGFMTELIEQGYLDVSIRCPSGGIYYWVTYPDADGDYRTVVGCSVHGEDKTTNVNIMQLTEEEDDSEEPPFVPTGG